MDEQIIEEEPEERRSRAHIDQILGLNEAAEGSMLHASLVRSILNDVKKIVETAVRPLEGIFKYNDVSNRNFGGKSGAPLLLKCYQS